MPSRLPRLILVKLILICRDYAPHFTRQFQYDAATRLRRRATCALYTSSTVMTIIVTIFIRASKRFPHTSSATSRNFTRFDDIAGMRRLGRGPLAATNEHIHSHFRPLRLLTRPRLVPRGFEASIRRHVPTSLLIIFHLSLILPASRLFFFTRRCFEIDDLDSRHRLKDID